MRQNEAGRVREGKRRMLREDRKREGIKRREEAWGRQKKRGT